MTYHVSWLYSLDAEGLPCEIINGQRLFNALGVTNACSIFQVNANECEWADGTLPLALDPCSVDIRGRQSWEPIDFNGPTDTNNPAPWWDGVVGSPSSQGYGFWIEEWTGLDSAHNTRSVSDRAGRRGGANFGPLTSSHRVWKINAILVGASTQGLNELFQWLEQQLMDCCNACGGEDMLIRTVCPPDGDPSYGVYRVSGTALLEGLTWEDAPAASLGCFIRRVSFTIGVADPCLYSCSTSCASGEVVPSPVGCLPFDLWAGCNLSCDDMADYRVCCPVPSGTRGSISPVVTLTNEGTGTSVPIRIYGMSDPIGIGCDPCSLTICQDIITVGIPQGATLMVDSAARRVLYRDASTGQQWVDGTPFLDPPPGTVPQFLSLSCDPGWVAIEPASFCGETEGLSIDIDIVSRVGCC